MAILLSFLFSIVFFQPCFAQHYNLQNLTPHCGCSLVDNACLHTCVTTGPASEGVNWDMNWFNLPNSDQVQFASPVSLDWARTSQIVWMNQTATALSSSNSSLRSMIGANIAQLPIEFQNLVLSSTVGLHLISQFKNNSFSGYSTFPIGVQSNWTKDAQLQGGFWLIDESRYLGFTGIGSEKSTLNFTPDNSNYKVRRVLANPNQDSLSLRIQYDLIYMFALNFGLKHKLVATPWTTPIDYGQTESLEQSEWNWERNTTQNIFQLKDQNFRVLAINYSQGLLTQSDIPQFFTSMQNTSVSTIESSAAPFYDFANSFREYVWVKLMNQPAKVEIYDGNTLLNTYDSCFNTNRCPGQESFFHTLFGLGL
ncbi:MAG: hypothetical protein AB8E15_08245 [Bdellovibrionales bacterium]